MHKPTGLRSGRKCAVCVHPDRDDIDRMIVVPGRAMAEVARVFKVNQKSVTRHRSLHLSHLIKSEAAQQYATSEAQRGGSLIDQANDYEARAVAVLTEAEEKRNPSMALRAIHAALECLQMRAKLAGHINSGTTVNIFNAPTWISLQANIVNALQPYPEAREAVMRALARPPE